MSIAALALILPFVLLSCLALFFLLRLLHRKLRIFTRGTIAFMTFAAVTFTVVDLVNLAQDIKFRDQHLREEAVRTLVGETAHRILDDEELTARVKHDQPDLEREIRRVGTKLAADLAELGLADAGADLQLACYRVRNVGHGLRRLVGRHLNQRWEVDAVVVDPARTMPHVRRTVFQRPVHCVITVYTLIDDEGNPRVAAVDGAPAARLNIASSVDFVWRGADWRNPAMDEYAGQIATR